MEIESPRGGEEKICSKKTFSFYECNLPDCGKKFRFLSQLERHLIHELQLRPFYCPHSGCSRTFKKKDTMENHYRLHTKERPFICELPYCRKTFPSKSGLRYHRTTHKNIRSFHCSFLDCDKTFPTKAQLKQHERATCIHYRYLSKAKMDDPLPSSDLENLVKSEFDFLKKENDPWDHLFSFPFWTISPSLLSFLTQPHYISIYLHIFLYSNVHFLPLCNMEDSFFFCFFFSNFLVSNKNIHK